LAAPADDPALVHLALERRWITPEQSRSGRPLAEILSPAQLRALDADRRLAQKALEGGLLAGKDLIDGPPPRFGRYEILRTLGEGASGRVFLARDPILRREVAVKVLHPGKFSPERFRREAAVLASIRHPNIVAIHDAGETDRPEGPASPRGRGA